MTAPPLVDDSRSLGMHFSAEEVAPPDARQQVLGATGWYDRVSRIMAGHAPAARAGRHFYARFKTSSASAWKWQCLVHEASRILSAGSASKEPTLARTIIRQDLIIVSSAAPKPRLLAAPVQKRRCSDTLEVTEL